MEIDKVVLTEVKPRKITVSGSHGRSFFFLAAVRMKVRSVGRAGQKKGGLISAENGIVGVKKKIKFGKNEPSSDPSGSQETNVTSHEKDPKRAKQTRDCEKKKRVIFDVRKACETREAARTRVERK